MRRSLRDPAFECTCKQTISENESEWVENRAKRRINTVFLGGVLGKGHVAVIVVVVKLDARDNGDYVVVKVNGSLIVLAHLL